jgi:hypothetical protein
MFEDRDREGMENREAGGGGGRKKMLTSLRPLRAPKMAENQIIKYLKGNIGVELNSLHCLAGKAHHVWKLTLCRRERGRGKGRERYRY